MSFKFFVFGVIATAMTVGCAHSQREVASVKTKKSVKVKSQSCKSAYNVALKSPSILDVTEAADVCLKASEAACTLYVENNSDGPGTGDGKYVAAVCELSAAYGANKAVNKGRVSGKCGAAYQLATKSPSARDISLATEVCMNEKEAICAERVNSESDGPNTGDGQWVASACDLTAAWGSYNEVTKSK